MTDFNLCLLERGFKIYRLENRCELAVALICAASPQYPLVRASAATNMENWKLLLLILTPAGLTTSRGYDDF